MRRTRLGVSNFIYCGDKYLFIKRSLDREDDPGKINAVGGKIELGENMVQAAIRETEEESGLSISEENMRFVGVLRIEGRESYPDDWVHFLFTTEVFSLDLPRGSHTEEGELLWIPKDRVTSGEYNVVDDLPYYFDKIGTRKDIMFMNAIMGENQRVIEMQDSLLSI